MAAPILRAPGFFGLFLQKKPPMDHAHKIPRFRGGVWGAGGGGGGDTEVPSLLGRTPRGSCNRTLLRRVLRRLSKSKCFLEGFLEGACKGFSVKTGFLEGSVL